MGWFGPFEVISQFDKAYTASYSPFATETMSLAYTVSEIFPTPSLFGALVVGDPIAILPRCLGIRKKSPVLAIMRGWLRDAVFSDSMALDLVTDRRAIAYT